MRSAVCYGGKGSAPPAPDYRGAALEQSAASKEIATQQTWANRPNQTTPWGQTTWNAVAAKDPSTGQDITRWEQSETLNPVAQQALNEQLAINTGKSQLAGSFMGRVADEYSTPFNWGGAPAAAQQQYTGLRNLQTGMPVYNLDTSAPYQRTSGYEGISPTGQDTSGLNQYTNPYQGISPTGQDTSGLAQRTSGYESISPTTQSTNQANFVNERQRIEQGLFDRMAPIQQRQEEQTRTMLANQGLTPGSEAYNRELERLHQNQSAERYDALMRGGEEQQRLQGMLMGQQQQAFGQQQQAGMFGLGAQQQAFGQQAASQAARNQALQNYFQQQQAAGQYGLGAQQQAFGQQQASQAARNQALQNYFQQQQAAGAFSLGAQQQAFGQDVGAQQAYNQALAQQQAMYGQAGSFYNQAQQQMSAQDLARNQQNFQQQMQARQQYIAEEAQRRGMSLNEMNALLTGAQVANPQMPSFMGASAGQAPNLLGAAQSQYQAGMDAFNAQQAQSQGMMSGIGSLVGTGAMIFM